MTDLQMIVQKVVGHAGANEQIEVVAVHDRDTEIRVYEGEIEQFTASESHGIGVRVISEGRQGFAWAGTLEDDAIAEVLAEARDNAGFGTYDESLGLAEPDGVVMPEIDLYESAVVDVPTDSKIALAMEMERRTREGDARIIGIESADYVDGVREFALASTTGIDVSTRESGSYVAISALAEENGETQLGFGFSVERNPNDLDVELAASDAVERATRLLGATQPPSERLTVVFDPYVTAQFLEVLGRTLSGEAVLKGYSLFAERLDEIVASPLFTLVDDPTRIEAVTASQVDGEGLSSRRNVLIDGGRLEMFVHNAYSARRAGAAPTGSAVRSYSTVPGVGTRALQVLPGDSSPTELISSIDNGVLIQVVSGIHSGVNPVSGDFSTGAEGLRIRNGALAEPVREVTIASTIQRMLGDIAAVGNDTEWLPTSAAGVTLVINDVTMSGT